MFGSSGIGGVGWGRVGNLCVCMRVCVCVRYRRGRDWIGYGTGVRKEINVHERFPSYSFCFAVKPSNK